MFNSGVSGDSFVLVELEGSFLAGWMGDRPAEGALFPAFPLGVLLDLPIIGPLLFPINLVDDDPGTCPSGDAEVLFESSESE